MPPPSNTIRDRLRHLRSWLAGDRRRQAAAGAAVLLLLAVIVAALAAAGVFSGGSPEAALNATSTPTLTPAPAPSPTPLPTEPTLLDGVLVYPEQLTEIQGRLPLAVMFDNFLAARPPGGG